MADDSAPDTLPDDAPPAEPSPPPQGRRIALVAAGVVLFLAGISSAWVIEVNEREQAQAARDAHHAKMMDHPSHHQMHMEMLQSAAFVKALTAALVEQGVDVTDAKVKAAIASALAAHMTSMTADASSSDATAALEQMRRHHPEMFAR